jgi:glyoxylase-like metal-dependent hydrolase (beta-lactamase superfamily II)
MKTKFIQCLTVIFLSRDVAGVSADSPRFRENRPTGRVLVLTQAPWAETMTVLEADSCLVIVDTWGSLSAAREAASFIDSLYRKPVRYVINTHHHWDHTFGNAAFPDAEIVGHRFCGPDMLRDYGDRNARKRYFIDNAATTRDPSLRAYVDGVGEESADSAFALVPPVRSAGDRDTLAAGDLTFLLYHTPGIHTRSNLTVFVPELGIVFGRREFLDRAGMKLEPGADPAVIERVLEDIRSSGKPIRFLIPGHGQAIENPSLTKVIERR